MASHHRAMAEAILKGGLAAENLKFVTSITCPLVWRAVRNSTVFQSNGSAFFVDLGVGPFAVTAAHVIDRWLADETDVRTPMLCGDGVPAVKLDFRDRLIATHKSMDIATFRVTPAEIERLGKTIFGGDHSHWPPPPPQIDSGVLISGYPGEARRNLNHREVIFGAAPAALVATSVNENDVTCQLDRAEMIGILGRGLPPENFDFGGMSGGPMLAVIERNRVQRWSLAGVVYRGPNPSRDSEEAIDGLEVICARRAHFINRDGTLDTARWHLLHL